MAMKTIALGLSLFAALGGSASAATLRAEALVAGPLVTIGDLFDGAGASAAIALFRSPNPGETGAVPSRDVIAAAKRAGLTDADAGQLQDVAVTRTSRDISVEELTRLIATQTASQLGIDAADIAVDLGANPKPVRVEATATGPATISRLVVDPTSGQFEATLDIAGRSRGEDPIVVTGLAYETIEAATLLRSIGRGDLVTAADVRIERKPKSRAPEALALADVVGLEAKRALRAGQTLRDEDLARPQYVQRGAFVTLIYTTDGLTLSLKAKALGAGSSGDVVSVQNLQSKRVVAGVVTGPSEVTVSGPATAIAVARR